MQNISPQQPVFLNVEFIFSWLYGKIGNIFSIEFFNKLKFFATILVILLITLILYCLVRLYEFKKEDEKAKKRKTIISNNANNAQPISPNVSTSKDNKIWQGIREKLLADNPSDWRLGIIEADIYMDKLFDNKGFPGDTLGDKLKNITPDQLASIQIAWEAHKVRNRIAHDGADFNLTMPESRRVLSYFEIVFRDLGAIE